MLLAPGSVPVIHFDASVAASCEKLQREMAGLHAKDADAGRRAAGEARRMVRNQRAKVNRVDEAHKRKRE